MGNLERALLAMQRRQERSTSCHNGGVAAAGASAALRSPFRSRPLPPEGAAELPSTSPPGLPRMSKPPPPPPQAAAATLSNDNVAQSLNVLQVALGDVDRVRNGALQLPTSCCSLL